MLRYTPAHIRKHTLNRFVMQTISAELYSELMSPACKDKNALTPYCLSSVSLSSELSREFKVNLNHPNPKINYAYPEEHGSPVNP